MMEYKQDARYCWQASYGQVEMGCCLSFDELVPKEHRSLKQVHGAAIIDDADWQPDQEQEADGLVTDKPNLALAIRTADCVPIHLTDGQRVCVLHAGWRGTKAGIVKAATAWFDFSKTIAFIGPAIAQVNYEVGPDFYESWLVDDPSIADRLAPGRNANKRLFDLKGLVAQTLRDCGISDVTMIPTCTFASSLPSYRREGQAASRIVNYIYRVK